jgi:two-component system response regulator RegA
MTETPPKKLLVCDDDADFRRRLARSLRDRGHEVYEGENAANGLEVVREFAPAGAIIDLRMPGESGLWLLKEIRALNPEIRVVVFTGFGSITTALEAVRLGVVNYVTKPASVDQVLAAFSPESAPANLAAPAPSLAQIENEYVNRVLAEKDGNVSLAAKVLGVHRRSLQRKLKR